MKNLSKLLSILFIASIALVSCRDEEKKDGETAEETTVIEGIEVDKDAKVEVNQDGDKVEITEDNREIEIQKESDGSIEKIKIDEPGKETKIKMEDGQVEKEKVEVK
ncbi:hypothetical protein [Mesonia sp. K7]|uniref:hypothetical protein n=1 Tax=Mesonia sp. K7 TaxID=2218606 RepID=UPI000DA91F56|nr:hypothetical protein [Mesonia sp. K7]PZD76789.1 hypothetical protein DNG35_11045 [Mesonia sp. K7]